MSLQHSSVTRGFEDLPPVMLGSMTFYRHQAARAPPVVAALA